MVPPQTTRERDAARKLNERRQAGSKPRETYLSTCRQVRQQALDLAAVGLSAADIGATLGKSKAAVKMLLSRARQEGLKPTKNKRNLGGGSVMGARERHRLHQKAEKLRKIVLEIEEQQTILSTLGFKNKNEDINAAKKALWEVAIAVEIYALKEGK